MVTFTVLHKGSGPVLEVVFKKGEEVVAESGSMISKSQHVTVEGALRGGWTGGLKRAMVGGSVFVQTLRATSGDENEALLAPSSHHRNDISTVYLTAKQEMVLASSCFLACDPTVQLSTRMQNLTQGFVSGGGLFVVQVKGPGNVAMTALGAMHRYTLGPKETRVIDNGHLVAWDSSVHYHVTRSSRSWFSSITSGEGLVCVFEGPGAVYVQTRKAPGPTNYGNAQVRCAPGACIAVTLFFALWFTVLFWIGFENAVLEHDY